MEITLTVRVHKFDEPDSPLTIEELWSAGVSQPAVSRALKTAISAQEEDPRFGFTVVQGSERMSRGR